ncbi:hypothetical protein ACT3SZ_15410 [Corynebacterium sp. AOP40-9SA-29]|uniref:hypothetical protein n=1 Tax=Corynebacterium sp. AOP40-9SA-29 TaxID=3457677 RepID=UPI004033E522
MENLLMHPILSVPGSIAMMGIPVAAIAALVLLAITGEATRGRWLVALGVLVGWAILREITDWGAVALAEHMPLVLLPAAWTAAAVAGMWAAWRIMVRIPA